MIERNHSDFFTVSTFEKQSWTKYELKLIMKSELPRAFTAVILHAQLRSMRIHETMKRFG